MNPFVGHTQTQGEPLTQTDILTQQLQNLQQQMMTMQTGNDKKSYTMQDLRPYPFDHTLYMSPFHNILKHLNFIDIKGRVILETISDSFL